MTTGQQSPHPAVVASPVPNGGVQEEVAGLLDGLARYSRRNSSSREFTHLGHAFINDVVDWDDLTATCGCARVEELLLEQRTDLAIEFAWLKVRDVIRICEQVRESMAIPGSKEEFYEAVQNIEKGNPRMDGKLHDLAEFAVKVSRAVGQRCADCFSYCGCNGEPEEIRAFLSGASEMHWDYRNEEEQILPAGCSERARSRVLGLFYARFGIPEIPDPSAGGPR